MAENIRLLLEAAFDAVLLIDEELRVREWNESAHALLGWTREEANARRVNELFAPSDGAPDFETLVQEALDSVPDVVRGRFTAKTRNGTKLPVELSLTVVALSEDGSRRALAIFARSLQQQWASEQRLVKQANEARLLHQATLISATAETFEEALSECLSVMCEVTGWPIGHVWLPDHLGTALVSSDLWRFTDGTTNPALVEASRGERLTPGEGLPGRIWQRGQPDWIPDTSQDPNLPRFYEGRDLGVRGAFGFPVFADGEIAAVVEFFSPDHVEPDPHLLLLVGTLGSHLGRVIEQRRWDEDRGRLAAIVDSSYDAIIGKTLDGRIVSWNGGAEVVYGYSSEEALGQPVNIMMPDDMTQEEAEILDVSQRGVPLRQFETVRRRKDGSLVDVSITVSPIRDARGRIIGVATIERDITLRKRREQELERATEQAQAANTAKSEFLANISHELRTPMNAIIGMVDLSLCDYTLPSAVRDYLETAQDSSQILLALMNDLLDFSRMEAGRFELEPDPFRLRRTLNEAMRILSLRAHEKGLELACEVDDNVPNYLEGDARRLRQIIMNLVGNAIKFTEQGEVTVSVAVEERSGDQLQLLITVRDTGIGIAPEHHARIFQPFTQVDASTTRQQTGTGLGLAICRELVERMGGDIGLESQPGKGATFFVTPRFRVIPDESLPDTELRVTRLDGLPILVVDDNATNRRILEEQLTRWGMRPIAVRNGHEALQQVRQAAEQNEAFPLLLVDALMPDMDGFTLIETLQRRSLMRGANILMLSSADRQSFEQRCRELRIAAYLEKPVSQSTLLDAILMALKHSVVSTRIVKDIASTSASLSILVAEDTPANQKVVRAILERRGHRVTLARNGQEAIELHAGHDFDVILMDVQMPGMDGLQATEAIRRSSDPRKAQVPIVAMTAHAMKRDRQRCLSAGMNAYMAKPIDAEALIELLESTERAVNARGEGQPIGHELATGSPVGAVRPPPSVSPSPRFTQLSIPVARSAQETAAGRETDASPINLASARARMGSDSLLQDMAGFFLEDAPELVKNIQRALRSQDADALTRHAHSLKGLASNFDAEPLTTLAKQIEQSGRRADFQSAAGDVDPLKHEAKRVLTALRKLRRNANGNG